MKTFIIFYVHSRYGNYTTQVEGKTIIEALQYFWDDYADGRTVYGIMEIK